MKNCDINGVEPYLRPVRYIFNHYLPISPEKKVEDIGVEPMTPCVQGRCSNQLS